MPRTQTGLPRPVRRRALLAVICAGSLLAGTAACSSTASAGSGKATTADPVKMKIETFTNYYGWLPYLAAKGGFFAKNGIDAQVVPIENGTVAFPAMANGTADVAMGDLSLAGPYLAKGVKLSLISGAVDAGWQLVAPKGSTLPNTYPASVQALKGKPVGIVAVGTSTYFFMRELAVSAGLGQNGINYVAGASTPSAAGPALQAHRVDAVMASPDLAYYLTHDLGGRVVFNFSDPGQLTAAGGLLGTLANTGTSGMWARQAWLNANPGVTAKFQRAMSQAALWAREPANLTEVINLLSKGNMLAKFEQGAQGRAFFTIALPHLTSWISGGEAGAKAQMSFWVKAGLLKQQIPTDQWYATGIPTTAAQAATQAGQTSGTNS